MTPPSPHPRYVGNLALALILAFSTSSFADDGSTTADVSNQQLKPIVVEGSGDTSDSGQREDLQPDSITNMYRVEASARFGTQIFTEKDIQAIHPENVFDLLDKAVGITLIYQGRRSPYMIEDRGGGTFTYIIDGAVLPSAATRILYRFPVAAIEQVEVVRGSTALTVGPSIPIGSSNSGSGLNTGFIIIRTKQPKKIEGVLTASASKGEGGQPIETKESLYVGARFGDTQQKEGNAEDKGSTAKASPSPIQGYLAAFGSGMNRPSEETWFDGQSNQAGMASGGFTYNKFHLNMMAYQDSGKFEMQRGISTTGALMSERWWYDPMDTDIYTSDMSMKWTPNQTTLFNIFKVSYNQTEHDGTFGSSKVTTMNEFNEDSKGFGLRHNARFGNTLVQAGWQMSQSTGLGPNLSNSYTRYDTTINGWSGSVEQKLFGDRLVLDGGYRQDVKHIDYSSTSASANNANNDVDMAPARVYALGARWKITDMFALSGRYYHGDEGTNGDFTLRAKSGTLDPERQERTEAALEANIKPWFKPTLTWFNVNTGNAKTATTSTYQVAGDTYYYYTQSDELRRGLELMVKGTVLKNTTYTFSWTRMLNAETTASGVTTDAIGLTVPKNMFGITLSHTWDPYRFNVSYKQVDKWTQTSSPKGTYNVDGIGDYTRFDVNVQRDFHLGPTLLTGTLFANNLTNQKYSTRYVTGYYPDRGRTIGVELSWAF